MPAQQPPHRILIAPAAFKGSLAAWDVAEIVRDFLERHSPEMFVLDVCPIADGGDNTLSVLHYAIPGFERHTTTVTGPLPTMQVQADFLIHPAQGLAVIEAAQANGLRLIPESGQRDSLAATSYGVGQLINAVLTHCQTQKLALQSLIVTLGGSASTDGGSGALQALGVQFIDKAGVPVATPLGGGLLSGLQRIEWTPQWPHNGSLLIATDVINPLLGCEGSAAVFAPQKGASSAQVTQLEAGLSHFAHLLKTTLLHNPPNPPPESETDYTQLPGAGAAGGLAYGLRHLPRSGIISGSQWVANHLKLEQRIAQADLIITGEGCLDATSLDGKATGHLLVQAAHKPVLFLCGQVQQELFFPANVTIAAFVNTEMNTGAEILNAMQHPKAALLKQLALIWPTLQAQLALQDREPS
jgi:glycerate kinase